MDRLPTSIRYLLIGLISAFAGCVGEARVDVHPVQGSVNVMGKPTGGVALQFHPANAAHQIFPRAVTAADGTFHLSTYEPNDGIPEGDYVVTASWRLVDSTDDMEMHPDELSLAEESLDAAVTDPETSPLRVTIVSGSNSLPPFEINLASTDKNRPKRKRRRSP